ncbi:MAG: ThuA domain-containing protein [Saprospiraceae bacterium]
MRYLTFLVLLVLFATPFYQSCSSSGGNEVLVFSYTKGYRHASIEKGQAAIQKLGQENGFNVTISEDPKLFNDESLKKYAAVIFLSTTGDILDSKQEAAFMRFIQAGGGFVGVHAAADTEYGWLWYGKLVGAYFQSHPNQQTASIKVTCDGSNACAHLPAVWTRWDEWYNYRNVQPDIKVIASLDETSYKGGNMNNNHPIAWYHEFDGGKAFYTGLGHTDSSYMEVPFLKHLLGGIQYSMNHKALDYSKAYAIDPPDEDRLGKKVLASNLDEPMAMDVMNDGSVLLIERKGNIKLYNPATGLIEYIAHKNVHHEHEDGLLGVALDPDFDQNQYIYLFYSPPIEESIQRVSRFELKNKVLDTSTEKIILTIPVQRQECCHSAGYLRYGKDGLLYISVGDNTNPFASDGFNPIDERPGRSPWDAQKSAGNSNDLRGKILRIKVNADATYSIPEGNLFKPGTPKTRPEIFVMGCRNPFRFSVDAKRHLVHWGDVGPDAGKDSVGRGPKGYDFFGQVGEGGGYFGWPYVRGNGHAYNDYDFATQKSGDKFNPAHLINNSPNNTGITELPPYKAPQVWYSYDESREFPFLGIGGKNPMAGPVYYKEDYKNAAMHFPDYFDGKLFIYEWMRRWIYVVTLDKDNNFIKFDPFMPNTTFANPMDMCFGPDGSMYILNYGTSWFHQNLDAQLFKIDYNGGNRKPKAEFIADKTIGGAPLSVNVDASASADADKDDLNYNWLINGIQKATGIKTKIDINSPGTYDLTLQVSDGKSMATSNTILQVGNEMPEVKIEVFGNKTFFWPGRKIPYAITINDKEDGNNETGTLSSQNIKVSAAFVQEGSDLAKLEAGGHLAGMNQSPFEAGRLLIDKSDCKTCHANDRDVNGPAYKLVAERYTGKPGIEKVLAQKVIKGGTGNWGDRAMAAHPQLSEAEVTQMVRYVLSLAGPSKDNASDVSNLLSGTTEVKESGKGTYVISAGYTDRGYNGVAALSNQATITLKNSALSPTEADIKSKGVMEYNAPKGKVMVINNKNSIGYKNIDFKDLKAIDITYLASHAGKLQLWIDDPNTGTKLTEITLTPSDVQTAPKVYKSLAELSLVRGMHDLYFVYIADDASNNSAACIPSLFEFKFGEM